MDGYAFATGATPEAVAALRTLAEGGTVRTMLPLDGDYALYASVAAPDAAGVVDKLAAVAEVPGLSGVQTHVATPPVELPWPATDSIPPTWGVPAAWIGFAVAQVEPGGLGDVLAAVVADPHRAGLTLAEDGPLIVQFTAAQAAGVAQSLQAVAAALGGAAVRTGAGEAAQGLGFTTA